MPSPPAPAKIASVAIATVETVAIRMPAMISGTASGISTCQSSCRSVIPIPRPASFAASGTLARPALAFR